MRLQQTIRKKPYLKPIIVGFAALYFLSMLLSTYLVKEKFEQEFLLDFYDIQNTIMQEFTVNDEEDSGGEYTNMLVSPIWSMGKYNQFSAAIYNSDGDKIAQTAIMITFRYMHQTSISDNEPYTGKSVFYYELLDYLTEEEFAEFMKYYEDGNQYSVQAYIQEDTEELAQIKVYNLKDGAYATEEVWNWENINVEQYTPMLITPRSNIPFELTDPTGGNYEAWLDSDYLQNYPDKIEELEEARLSEDINADTWVIEENVEKGEDERHRKEFKEIDVDGLKREQKERNR